MPATGPAALDGAPRRRAVLLAAPWAVALALVAAALVLRPQVAATSGPPGTLPADGPTSPVPGTPLRRTTAVPAGTLASSPPGLPAVAHIQVLAHARAALGTAGLATDGYGRTDRWPVEVRIAEITAVTDTLAIATVHALVIEVGDTGWTGPVLRAAAVPLVTAPEVRVAGPGWPIAAPSLPAAALQGETVADPDPAVVAPLEEAGWEVDELVAVELVGGTALQVTLRGVPPDGGAPGRHVVWLLDAPGGPRLLPLDASATAQHQRATPPAQYAPDAQEST